ncbi:MAG: hypothetical protein J6T01_05595 [Kiritimatiellae bacterium]|nr:hypothetical protein [Kiritimatiellia bacterium]
MSGWNGSADAASRAADGPVKDRRRVPPALKGAVAGLLVVGGAVAWFLMSSTTSTPGRSGHERPRMIKEVRPAAAGKAAAPEPVKKTRVQLQRERGCYTNELGYVFNRPTSKVVFTNDLARTRRTLADKVFTNPADRKIGNLLLIPPGATLVGEPPKNYYGRIFVKNFLKSIREPFIVTSEDPPEVADLKRAVIDAKIELKERYDAGEDIGTIMANERRELQNLGLYRQELDKELKKIARRKDLTAADMQDFVTAANKMLADRGAGPLKMPVMAVRRFQLAESGGEDGAKTAGETAGGDEPAKAEPPGDEKTKD